MKENGKMENGKAMRDNIREREGKRKDEKEIKIEGNNERERGEKERQK